jgi:hypothetical protein
MREEVESQLREARDQVHEALLALEHLVPDLVDDVLQIDGIDDDLNDLRNALDSLSDDIRHAINRVRHEINCLANNLPAEHEELAL